MSIKIEDLKVGMKVRIREDLKEFVRYGANVFVDQMECYLGNTVTVRKVSEDFFEIEEGDKDNDNEWHFTPEMIDLSNAHSTKNENDNTFKQTINCTFTGDKLPSYSKVGDSGLDLHAFTFQEIEKGSLLPVQDFLSEGYVLAPHDRVLVHTGLKMDLNEGIDATIRPRSGLTLKYGIVAQIGLIDNNYQGDVGVILLNTSNDEYVIHKGDRLGQLRFSKPVYVELNIVDELDSESNRGETGFGNSGR